MLIECRKRSMSAARSGWARRTVSSRRWRRAVVTAASSEEAGAGGVENELGIGENVLDSGEMEAGWRAQYASRSASRRASVAVRDASSRAIRSRGGDDAPVHMAKWKSVLYEKLYCNAANSTTKMPQQTTRIHVASKMPPAVSSRRHH